MPRKRRDVRPPAESQGSPRQQSDGRSHRSGSIHGGSSADDGQRLFHHQRRGTRDRLAAGQKPRRLQRARGGQVRPQNLRHDGDAFPRRLAGIRAGCPERPLGARRPHAETDCDGSAPRARLRQRCVSFGIVRQRSHDPRYHSERHRKVGVRRYDRALPPSPPGGNPHRRRGQTAPAQPLFRSEKVRSRESRQI